jgi:hypothetical protein
MLATAAASGCRFYDGDLLTGSLATPGFATAVHPDWSALSPLEQPKTKIPKEQAIYDDATPRRDHERCHRRRMGLNQHLDPLDHRYQGIRGGVLLGNGETA